VPVLRLEFLHARTVNCTINLYSISMKPISILALAGLAAAADYPAFTVPYLTTNQPNGDKFSHYWIDFNVTSETGDALSWCLA
jgi:hypothetical protein